MKILSTIQVFFISLFLIKFIANPPHAHAQQKFSGKYEKIIFSDIKYFNDTTGKYKKEDITLNDSTRFILLASKSEDYFQIMGYPKDNWKCFYSQLFYFNGNLVNLDQWKGIGNRDFLKREDLDMFLWKQFGLGHPF